MIRYISELSVTDSLRETMYVNDSAFPFAASELNVIEYVNNCAKWHWHGFVEFAYVVCGQIECCTPKGAFSVQPGEGYFINANALHMIRMAADASDAKYRVLQFETSMLAGSGVIGRRFVIPIERCGNVHALKISRTSRLEHNILDDLIGLFQIAEEETPPYELRILRNVAGIWTELFSLMEPMLENSVPATDTASSRVKTMLAYIHEHFSEPMNVADLAAAANISKREAYRAFQEVLGTTPTSYILQHRVNCGARMLMETSQSITEISMACGFASPSYFCKAFHDLTGVSPRDFRKASVTHVEGRD